MSDPALRIASALCFGGAPLGRGSDLSAAIPTLRRNRLPTAVSEAAELLAEADRRGCFRAYFEDERARHESQLAGYLEIARAWASENIDGILIKSPGYFPYTSSNVDVLVESHRAPDACRILESLGYVELAVVREPYKRLFRRLRTPGLGFAVHVHTAVAWINHFWSDAEVREDHRSDHETGLRYPSAENVFLITTAHWLFEDKELTLRDLYHASAAVRDGVDWESIRERAAVAGWAEGLELALALYRAAANRVGAEEFSEALPPSQLRHAFLARERDRAVRGAGMPLTLSKPLCKGLQLVKSFRNPRLTRRGQAREAAQVLYFMGVAKLPLHRNGPALAVAISGPDGVGKTTLARSLQRFLERDVGVSANYTWTRLGSSPVLELLRSLGEPLVRASNRIDGPDMHGRAHSVERKALLYKRPGLRQLWCYVLLADFALRHWGHHARCRFTGGIYIFDRHALDAAVDLAFEYGFSRPRLAIALTPRASVPILLRRQDIASFSPDVAQLYDRYLDEAVIVFAAQRSASDLAEDAAAAVVAAFVRATRA